MIDDCKKDYAKLICEDDIYLLSKIIKSTATKKTRSRWTNARAEERRFENFYILGDDNPLIRLTVEALDSCKEYSTSALGIGLNFYQEHIRQFSIDDDIKFDKNTAALLSVNCDNVASSKEWLNVAEGFFKKIGNAGGLCVVSALLPDFPNLPDGIGALAEREFDAHIRMIKTPTPEQSYFLRVEELCRRVTREYGVKIILLRIPNVFGPGYYNVHNWALKSIFKDVLESSEVVVAEQDFLMCQSLTYILDAAAIGFYMLYNGASGNIYNFSSYNTTLAELKLALHKGFSSNFGLQVNSKPKSQMQYRSLSKIKIEQADFAIIFEFDTAICRTFCFESGFTYIDPTNEKIYLGKLDRIKELEMDILKEVDRICEKYNLKYFLAAGTLLGAKRYGHNIPWDDDLDVAFLRKDFKKFRKIIEKELDPKFTYCSWYNEAKSHYTVDKIRIKDSWYSTKYSSSKIMPDGIFVDILVYDATSDIPFLAAIHNKIAGVYQWFLLQVLWFDLRKRDFRNPFLYLIYCIIMLIPINLWHWMFERWLMLFSFKQNPKFFIDGLGARAGIKLIPSKGLFDTVKIPFENGFMAASPEDPEGYLQFAYGENYLNEPPISEQKLHHNPARIDLGDKLFKENDNEVLPPIDLRGELFE